MSELPHLREIFERLRKGHHVSREDEPEFSSLAASYDGYAAYFSPLGLSLIRHPRDFFFFAPSAGDAPSDGLPRIAVFSYILVDHAAATGRAVDDFFFAQNFVVASLPHFSLDRYKDLLKQVDVRDFGAVRKILFNMKQYNWIQFIGASTDEFRFLRPFHRMLDKCLEVCTTNTAQGSEGGRHEQ